MKKKRAKRKWRGEIDGFDWKNCAWDRHETRMSRKRKERGLGGVVRDGLERKRKPAGEGGMVKRDHKGFDKKSLREL